MIARTQHQVEVQNNDQLTKNACSIVYITQVRCNALHWALASNNRTRQWNLEAYHVILIRCFHYMFHHALLIPFFSTNADTMKPLVIVLLNYF